MADSAGGEHTVLVVDDEAEFADSVALWLREHWTVEVATSGEDALDAYTPDVDAVLLDRRMPRMSGDEVLHEIRDREGNARVAMMTAVQPDWDIVEMEFDLYVKKPVTKEEVIETTQKLLSRAEYARELQALFALSEKVGALRAKYSAHELENDDRFQRLQDELERVQAKANDRLGELDEDEFKEVMTLIED
ncbi:response regulator [Salarchaeum japonicum]|uniref:Response regulator n=1 Tax=Salarchaeum japonicum TaxID=555573 RepID=A0AAV3T583_9EURY|nr:response regulator [Salarchaeum japonicum]